MLESALSQLIITALSAGLTARSLTAQIKKDNQPRQQGNPTSATLFFRHIGTINVGWPERIDTINKTTGGLDHTETQRKESRYQISALAPANLTDPTAPLTADYVNAAAAIMQSDATRALLLAANVGIQKPGNINLTYFLDEKGQHESNPTFDFILSHQDIFTTQGMVINAIIPSITNRV